MRLSLLRIQRSKIIMVAMLGLAIGTGTMHATNVLTSATSTVALSCSTVTGPTQATVVVKPVTTLTTNSLYITTGSLPAGMSVSPTLQQTLNSANQAAGITYTFTLTSPAAGCVGFTNIAAATFNFKSATSSTGATQTDFPVTVSATLAATTSGLTVAPSGTLALTCSLNGSTYIPEAAQTMTITSAATAGTPFSIDTTVANAPAAWITLSSTAGGTANPSGITFTVAPTAGCGGYTAASGTKTTTINLLNAPAPTKTITVTLTVSNAAASPLSVSPSGTITVTCVLSGSTYTPYGSAQTMSVTSAAGGGTAFTVDTAANPYATWLALSSTAGGTATATPVTFTVNAAAGCGAQPLGTYNTSIHLLDLPLADKLIPVTMNVIAPPASNLLVSPAAITLTCLYNVSGSTPQTGPTVSVTSAATGGTSFTTATGFSSWLTLNPASPVGTNVGAVPVTFTANVTSSALCGSGAVGTSKTTTIHLVDAPALDKLIPVTMLIVGGPTLTATPLESTALSYTKGSGNPVYVDVKVTGPNEFCRGYHNLASLANGGLHHGHRDHSRKDNPLHFDKRG